MRILILLPCQPFPAYNGQTHRLGLVSKSLARDHEVALACFVQPDQSFEPPARERERFLDMRMVDIAPPPDSIGGVLAQRLSSDPSDVYRFRSAAMTRHVEEMTAQLDPDVVLVGDPALTQYVTAMRGRMIAMDYVCEAVLQLERLAALAGPLERPAWALRRAKYARFLRRIEPIYDVAFLNSREDVDSLARIWPASKLMHVANGLDLDDYPTGLAKPNPNRLIYPGSVSYAPNLDAVAWFATEILPTIRAAHPQVEVRVTGAKPDDGRAPEAAGLVYTGRVPDVREEIAAAWATIVPLRLGAGGARFKVIESMALSTALVGTAIGIEGLELADGEEYLHAEKPQEFAEACLKLLKDEDLRHRIAAAGRRRMELSYDWRALSRRIEERLLLGASLPRAMAS